MENKIREIRIDMLDFGAVLKVRSDGEWIGHAYSTTHDLLRGLSKMLEPASASTEDMAREIERAIDAGRTRRDPPKADEWIAWPDPQGDSLGPALSKHEKVMIRDSDGQEHGPQSAGNFYWGSRINAPIRIIAYKIIGADA